MKLNTKKKYIAAVSGGPDSMAMLDKFKKVIKVVAHVNYHKRIDSDYDTEIVKKYCLSNNIKFEILNVDKKIYEKSQQHNFQALARMIRYDFFVTVAKKYKCFNLLVAHNLNDFLETAIMQKNRKSLNFFYGIREISKYKNLTIYRPLISVWKDDLEKYCIKNNIEFAIDSSNSSDIYERNRVRKEIKKLSSKELLQLVNSINRRNKKFDNIEKKTKANLDLWQKSCFASNFIKKSNFKKNEIYNLLYLYLKNNEIENINLNKLKLVRDFIFSNKPNHLLRLQSNKNLVKKNQKLLIKEN